tara:strand:+ start:192612 stop:192869 length:258 start_codon:yes stop_codon:yes gene_type:complete
MSVIKFTNDEKAVLVQKLKAYLASEMDHEVGQFECEFLLDFISEEIGAYFYNKGLDDAQALVRSKMEDITDAFYEIEQATSLGSR